MMELKNGDGFPFHLRSLCTFLALELSSSLFGLAGCLAAALDNEWSLLNRLIDKGKKPKGRKKDRGQRERWDNETLAKKKWRME